MRLFLVFLVLHIARPVLAADHDAHESEHGGQIFHMFRLEADYGVGQHDAIGQWDLDGWIGNDENKLWLRSEGEVVDDDAEQAELWAMYSRNIAAFWDAQMGVRQDFEPNSLTYLAVGFEGLAPYFFETEAHLFISDEGDVSARVRQENDLLVTQRLILQPYFEANLYAQDVEDRDIGSGLTDVEFGLQTRYEITRKFAPYFELRYERKIGESYSIAKRHSEDYEEFVVSAGLRLMF